MLTLHPLLTRMKIRKLVQSSIASFSRVVWKWDKMRHENVHQKYTMKTSDKIVKLPMKILMSQWHFAQKMAKILNVTVIFDPKRSENRGEIGTKI